MGFLRLATTLLVSLAALSTAIPADAIPPEFQRKYEAANPVSLNARDLNLFGVRIFRRDCSGTQCPDGCNSIVNAVCCNNGGACRPGRACCAADGCVPLDGSMCCSDGGYCDPGRMCAIYNGIGVCCTDNTCRALLLQSGGTTSINSLSAIWPATATTYSFAAVSGAATGTGGLTSATGSFSSISGFSYLSTSSSKFSFSAASSQPTAITVTATPTTPSVVTVTAPSVTGPSTVVVVQSTTRTGAADKPMAVAKYGWVNAIAMMLYALV